MKVNRTGSIIAGVLLALVAWSAPLATTRASAEPAGATGARRTTLAITYGEGISTSVDMMGSPSQPGVLGRADVKRKDGRTRVRLHMEPLPHPQSLGSFYSTYLLWAVAPEGQAASLAELPHAKAFDIDVTTSFQTFGLIVTAEPHSAVGLPSPLIIAENTLRRDTVGRFQTGKLEYGGAGGVLYEAAGKGRRDYATPLLVLGARRAVDLAKDAGAADYANKELQQAESRLETLEQAWPGKRELPKELAGMARDVMRTSEHVRKLTEERREEARLAAERRAASAQVARAETEAGRARDEAGRAREDAEKAREHAAREQERAADARSEAERSKAAEERARATEEMARAQAERTRQEAEAARLEAERARLETEQARRDKDELQRRLFQSLSAILETRREARGLIVSLSDVLFDFDRATLTPGAREKLSKLAGVLLAYPGSYRIDVEGHTDSIGTHEYNMALSRDRAESVRGYLLGSGIPAGRVGSATGFGKTRPVASNDNAAGRQMNRRVEIVIADLD